MVRGLFVQLAASDTSAESDIELFGGAAGLLCHIKSLCQNIVLMVSMLSGYSGGSITPITLLR